MQTAPRPVTDPKTPDPELARRVADGDREAFKVMMKRHNQALFRTARAILKNDEEAQDSVQESWLHAHRSMGSFRGDAKLSTWLVRIAVNESLGRLRRQRRGAEVIPMSVDDTDVPMQENMPDESHAAAPEVQALRGEVRKLIESRIDKLPDAFRTVFVLRAVEEMSVEETAAALDIPEATVRTRFFRARSLLRESLSREMDVAVEGAFSFLGERCDRIAAAVLARLG
ncbi:MAG TPA: RNA polymerase sigma factor [Burkholderiales bacterium]|nr:RNA polymerase sigma factor [Burkholderiales bacterium]